MAGKNPTMVIRLTERLRDYELTARYVNDFIATISDMNVISPGHHRDTKFRSLVEQVEAQLMSENHKEQEAGNSASGQSASGGMNIGGNLQTGGDVISISGVGAGSNIAAGKGASVRVATNPDDANKDVESYKDKKHREESEILAPAREDLKAAQKERSKYK
jgi:hypothetical protein